MPVFPPYKTVADETIDMHSDTIVAKKILIVDDEAKIVEMVKAYLEAEGYAVCSAENGVEALARNREYTPDLIILDRMLPDIAG